MTVLVIVISMSISVILGVIAIRNIENRDADKLLLSMCETGQKNLNYYFQSVEQSVEMVSAYVESDLDGLDDEHLKTHLERVRDIFEKLTYKTHGVMTYYYRIDPAISDKLRGFWYEFIYYNFEGVEKKAVWLPLDNGMRLNVSVPVKEINADWHN